MCMCVCVTHSYCVSTCTHVLRLGCVWAGCVICGAFWGVGQYDRIEYLVSYFFASCVCRRRFGQMTLSQRGACVMFQFAARIS